MSIALFGITLVLFILYAHVSNNVERYSNSGHLVTRTIVVVMGLIMGAVGAFLFLKNIADPTWGFSIGFLVGPLLAVGACVYLIVAFFFPLQQVRGLLRYSFRHKLTDSI